MCGAITFLYGTKWTMFLALFPPPTPTSCHRPLVTLPKKGSLRKTKQYTAH